MGYGESFGGVNAHGCGAGGGAGCGDLVTG